MDERPIDLSLLRAFSPLDGLKPENLHALARKTQLRELDSGRVLFKEGDTDKRTFYLVSGNIELRNDERIVGIVRGGSPEARAPLAPGLPRKFTARAAGTIEYVVIDSDLLDVLLTWDQTGQYEVTELHGDGLDVTGDWMTTLLQTKAFHRIPPANIQAIFMRMQRINYRAKDVVIKQGTEGDYFYVVVSGKCLVTRETPLNKEGIKLAELGPGDSFGEEALIAEAKRNATVTMATDGTLMRLGKNDFQTLLNEPLLQWVTPDKAREIVARGGKWLDVRLPSEFQNFRIDEAVNIPLYFIRLKLNALDKNTPYVVCCDTGRRSSAAAYILSERGFDAYVLKGGLAAADKAKRSGRS
ncbi:MAG TPA: cyclic nucleotide-binding domain-containing protein [Steroidobacteraceae bacterium]|nr:cyclic nucleotide-binding domain-containing protein [Steroidobacteraceae bacterium]